MVLNCLHYNTHNGTTDSCGDSYEQCAKDIECPSKEDHHHCFAVYQLENPLVLSSQIKVLSAGCNPQFELETCGQECIGKTRGRVYYCCCTEDNCNKNFTVPTIFPPPPDIPQQSNLSTPSGEFPWIIVLVLIIVIAFIIGTFVLRKSLKRSSNGPVEDANGSDGIHRSYRDDRNRNNNNNNNNNNNLNDRELNELRNNQDVAILMPLRNSYANYASKPPNNSSNNNINNDHNKAQLATRPNHSHHDALGDNQSQQQQQQCYTMIDLKNIKLLEIVGSGRFGTVHKANIVRNDNDNNNETTNNQLSEIAVKIIHASEQQSWQNELKIYSSPKTRHPNILGFLGSCQHVGTDCYWLLVEYASKGSLHHYLKHNTVSWDEFLAIALGIVHGLSHLHDADIAHRDFKSKNVLLKHDLTPCITDFGVAAMLDNSSGSQTEQRKKYLQVGTPRYMAPEVLECSVTFTKISFTKIDVYALSLVLWELISRCHPLPKLQQYDNDDSIVNSGYLHSLEERPLHSPQPLQMFQSTHQDDFHQQHNYSVPPTAACGLLKQVPDGASDLGIGSQQRPPASSAPAPAPASSDRPQQNDVADEQTKLLDEELLQPKLPPYKMPFEDVVGPNPDINTMRQIVIAEKLRPPIRPEWHFYPVSKLCQAIIDGWEYDHDARISASCFVERIEGLQQQLQLQQQQHHHHHHHHHQQQHQPQQISELQVQCPT